MEKQFWLVMKMIYYIVVTVMLWVMAANGYFYFSRGSFSSLQFLYYIYSQNELQGSKNLSIFFKKWMLSIIGVSQIWYLLWFRNFIVLCWLKIYDIHIFKFLFIINILKYIFEKYLKQFLYVFAIQSEI